LSILHILLFNVADDGLTTFVHMKRGVRIAIDDFGTGYSSLAYLGRFPVDRIKLAQEFIVDLVTDPRHAAIVQAAIGLARLLGIDMIAEGVETEQQLGVEILGVSIGARLLFRQADAHRRCHAAASAGQDLPHEPTRACSDT
jgi:sensor c-di-GMP phosphodiesterase-like protein